MTTEKFCLRWNDFERSISGAFKELRDDKDFFDVTIACDDEQVSAHKVILGACSPFFRKVLQRNPHQHPLLYLKGVKFTDLQSVLNFMYHGEVNVAQDELNSFLAVAEDLKVKGLTQSQSLPTPTKIASRPTPKPAPPRTERIKHTPAPAPVANYDKYDDEIQEVTLVKPEPDLPPPEAAQQLVATFPPQNSYPSYQPPTPGRQASAPARLPPAPATASAIPDVQIALQEEGYEEYEDYEETNNLQAVVTPDVPEGLQPGDLLQYTTKDLATGKHICTLCTSFSHSAQANVRNHIESKHFPGTFVYTCQICGKQSPSHQGLLKHKSKWHKGAK